MVRASEPWSRSFASCSDLVLAFAPQGSTGSARTCSFASSSSSSAARSNALACAGSIAGSSGALAGRFHRLMDVVTLLVKPETVKVGWHRAAWRLIWRWRSDRPPGRPPSIQISAFRPRGCGARIPHGVRRSSPPNWRSSRLPGLLRTVAKYRPSDLDRQRGQRWTTFIRNHLHETWACDFFVLVTAIIPRPLRLRRSLPWAGARSSTLASPSIQRPAGPPSASPRRPAMLDPDRFLVHDRDSIYGTDFYRQRPRTRHPAPSPHHLAHQRTMRSASG